MFKVLNQKATEKEKASYLSLMHEYTRELAKIENDAPGSTLDLITMYMGFLNEPNIDVIKLVAEDNSFVGFIILENLKNDTTAPFDMFIVETYLQPEHRKHGIVSSIFSEYIKKNNINSVGYVVLPNNDNADRYWGLRFSELEFVVERNKLLFPSKFKDCKCYIARK